MTDLLVADTVIDIAATRRAVNNALRDFLQEKARLAEGTQLAHVARVLRDFADAGGKRVRPVIFLCGWHAAGGAGQQDEVLRAAASLEMFHMFALIHDDIMDGSDTRRGQPTVHHALAASRIARAGQGERGDAGAVDHFGTSSAMLVGDLALVWSDELLHGSGLPPGQLQAARPYLDIMRTEVMLGQYLDLLGGREQAEDLAELLTMIRYKTAKYTVERPLHFGASLAGGGDDVIAACTDFALPIGEAFQLRDDLLGVFGDPSVTGKSRLDDLRAGKATTLLACAMQRADAAQRSTLRRLVGDPDLDEETAAVVRGIFTTTGAVAAVEVMIRERRKRGLAALDRAPFRPVAIAALRELALAATVRTS